MSYPPERRADFAIVISLLAGFLVLPAIYVVTRMGALPVAHTMPLVLIAGALVIVAAWRSWQQGIQILLVVVIVEGTLRKWFLPSASEMVYFYKDVLMVVMITSYLVKGRK